MSRTEIFVSMKLIVQDSVQCSFSIEISGVKTSVGFYLILLSEYIFFRNRSFKSHFNSMYFASKEPNLLVVLWWS